MSGDYLEPIREQVEKFGTQTAREICDDLAEQGHGADRPAVVTALGVVVEVQWEKPDGDGAIADVRTRFIAGSKERMAEVFRVAAETVDEKHEPRQAAPKPGRNDPCDCGSGKKAKRCCYAG